MNHLGFTIARYVSLPVALVLGASWLLLPSRLQVDRSVETTAQVTRGTFKSVPVAYLLTPAFGELRMPCRRAQPLCDGSAVPRKAIVKVWMQKPGWLYGHWVVQAELDGRFLLTPHSQVAPYREFKWMWGLGTLATTAVAALLWGLGPFRRIPEDDA